MLFGLSKKDPFVTRNLDPRDSVKVCSKWAVHLKIVFKMGSSFQGGIHLFKTCNSIGGGLWLDKLHVIKSPHQSWIAKFRRWSSSIEINCMSLTPPPSFRIGLQSFRAEMKLRCFDELPSPVRFESYFGVVDNFSSF